MMSSVLDIAVKFAQIASYCAGAFAAVSAFFLYRSNSRRERARWAEGLYVRFFEQSKLKEVRDALDCDAPNPRVTKLVSDESSDWTDYLNFFEFVAYLQSSRQLLEQDVQAPFGYYLQCLKKHQTVLDYIRDRSKGFDYLREMLLNE